MFQILLLGLGNGVSLWSLMSSAPLFYILLMGITSTGAPIVVTLKILGPLLLGLLGFVAYNYAHKALSWSSKKSLILAILSTLYFVALRISWDMFRSELALIFLFLMLIFLQKNGNTLRNGFFISLNNDFSCFHSSTHRYYYVCNNNCYNRKFLTSKRKKPN